MKVRNVKSFLLVGILASLTGCAGSFSFDASSMSVGACAKFGKNPCDMREPPKEESAETNTNETYRRR